MVIIKCMMLKNSPALDNPDQYGDYRNYQKNMDKIPGAEGEEPDCPGDNQDYCNDIKKISHDCFFYDLCYFLQYYYRERIILIPVRKINPAFYRAFVLSVSGPEIMKGFSHLFHIMVEFCPE